jgi:gliding motility-associated-like protein
LSLEDCTPCFTAPQITVVSPTCQVATGGLTVTYPIGSQYSYSLDGVIFQTSPVFVGLIPDAYTITVKDSGTCVDTVSTVINTLPGISLTVSSTTVCIGSNATVTALPTTAGTYTYVWTVPAGATNPGNVATFTASVSGAYTVAITDTVTGCESLPASTVVQFNPNPTVSVNSPTACFIDGATVVATPAESGSYNYLWTVPSGTNPGNVASFTTTIPGLYSVIITNTVTGCESASASGTVTINPQPIVTTTATTVCVGASSTVTASPGTAGAYTYVWTTPSGVVNPGSVASFITTVAGTYSVIITDTTTNCSSESSSVTVQFNALPTITASATTVCVGEVSTVTATTTATGTYLWTVPSGTNPGNVASFTTTIPGAYSVVVTDAATGCMSTAASTLVQFNPLPSAPVVAVTPSGCNGLLGTATVTSPVGNYEYSINGIDFQTSVLFAGLTDGTYQIQAREITTGCLSATAPFAIIELGNDVVANMPTALEYCDPDNNGSGVFNLLNPITLNEITGGHPDMEVTFHETYEEANAFGGNQAPNPGNYNSIVTATPPQIIYVRVTSRVTNCYEIVTLPLIVHPTPVLGTPSALHECDDNIDGVVAFDLTEAVSEVLVGIDPTTVNVEFFMSQNEAENTGVAISPATNYSNTSSPFTQTVWVKVTYIASGCFKVVPLQLVVDPLPVHNGPQVLTMCDANAPGNDSEIFDLTASIPLFIGTQTGMNITFHYTVGAAIAGTLDIPMSQYTAFSNTANPQTLAVRIENATTGCFVTTLLDLRVQPLPSIALPSLPLTICDFDADGFGNFDLAALIPGLQNGATGVTITFHETPENAEAGVLPINTSVLYPSISGVIYVRATEAGINTCHTVAALPLLVNPSPVIPALSTLEECDYTGNRQDGITVFNLRAQDSVIINAQTTPLVNYTITYYPSLILAEQGTTGAIATPQTFTNTTPFQQTIWVRINNGDTSCYQIASFDIKVNLPLQVQTVPAYTLCDADNNPNDNFTTFDLTIKENEFTQGLGGYTVMYYLSEAAAAIEDSTQLIQTPTAFVNTLPGAQTIGVVVLHTATGCKSFGRLTLRVEPIPMPNFNPTPLEVCDDSLPTGTESFDLTVSETEISNQDPDLIYEYYMTQAGAETQNPAERIADPANHESASGSVWVRVMNEFRIDYQGINCYAIVELPLVVNPLPLIADNPLYPICEPQTDNVAIFTLNTQNAAILGATQSSSEYTVSYYLEPTLLTQLPNSYQNISNPQVVYVKVTNNATGCENPTGIVTLLVEEGTTANPIASTHPDLVQCDEYLDNDGHAEFDLTVFTSEIIGANNPADVVVYYYDDAAAMTADLAQLPGVYANAIALPEAYVNTTALSQTIYAVVVNPNTTSGCPAITPLTLTIHELPEPTLNEGTVCINSETGVLITTHTIYSNLDPATHTFIWTDELGNQVGTGADYEASQAGEYTLTVTHVVTGCVNTKVVLVRQSEPPTVAYQVTNAFTDNQIITVYAQGVTSPDLNNGNYVYSIDGGAFQTSNVFENVGAGEHTIVVHDTLGCEDVTIIASVINYPKFFTPNGDNHNDTWNIIGLHDQLKAKIYIFDRYGKLLKQLSPSNESDGWDGTYNGRPLPSTDYWFTVEYIENNQTKVFKSHFALKR